MQPASNNYSGECKRRMEWSELKWKRVRGCEGEGEEGTKGDGELGCRQTRTLLLAVGVGDSRLYKLIQTIDDNKNLQSRTKTTTTATNYINRVVAAAAAADDDNDVDNDNLAVFGLCICFASVLFCFWIHFFFFCYF